MIRPTRRLVHVELARNRRQEIFRGMHSRPFRVPFLTESKKLAMKQSVRLQAVGVRASRNTRRSLQAQDLGMANSWDQGYAFAHAPVQGFGDL